jgi:hypothetical protein
MNDFTRFKLMNFAYFKRFGKLMRYNYASPM